MHVPKVLKIKEILTESESVKTFIFDWDMENSNLKPEPGQFMMIWNFEDEKPMSISKIDDEKNEISISIKSIGPFTNKVHQLNIGDQLGLRGPYGHGFEINDSKKILAIGGGIGMAPMASFAEYALQNNLEVDVISAAATKNELLFVDRLQDVGANVVTCTDDGSCGFKGFATHRMEDLLKNNNYDLIVTCGPEIMMKGIVELAETNNIPCQVSMERWMKCALGVCGQCCVDDSGWRICKEGPVFWASELSHIKEFAKYRRDSSGTRHNY